MNGLAVKVTEVPAQILVDGDVEIVTDGVTIGFTESVLEQLFVLVPSEMVTV